MIRLPTPTAVVELYDRFDQACMACNVDPPRDCELGIDVQRHHDETPPVRLALCAQCAVEAFAVHFGRRHVEAGGEVTDLTWGEQADA